MGNKGYLCAYMTKTSVRIAMTHPIRLALPLLCLLLCGWTPGQLRAREKPHVVNYTRAQYGAANKNWAVAQDEKGVMYFANDAGLLESDGTSWHLYSHPDNSLVRALAVRSHNLIYTGGDDELGCWRRDRTGSLSYTSFRHLLPAGCPGNESFWRVGIDGDHVYFQSFSHIYSYDGHSLKAFSVPRGFLFLHHVRDEWWVQEMYGPLYRLKEGLLERVPGSEFLKGSLVRVLLPYGDDHYLVGTAGGEVYLYDGADRFIPWNLQLFTLLRGKELNCGIYASGRDSYFLGTLLDGIYEVDRRGSLLNHFNTGNLLQNNTILSLAEDKYHNIWAALDRGLAYMRYTPGLSYYVTADRNPSSVYAATLWQDYLLVGTNQGVFYTRADKADDLEMFSTLSLLKGSEGQVWDFYHLNDGRLYCCHNNGMLELTSDLRVRRPYPFDTGVFRFLEGTVNGKPLQIIVTYTGLYVTNVATGRTNAITQVTDPVTDAVLDHTGNIWLKTVRRGVWKCRLNDALDAFRYYTYYGHETDPGLPADLGLFRCSGRIVFLGDNRFYTYNENADQLLPDKLLNDCFAGVEGLKRLVPIDAEESWAVASNAIYRFHYDGYIARIEESYRVGTDDLALITEYENISVLNDSISLVCLDAGFILHNARSARSHEVTPAAPSLEYVQTGRETGQGYVDLRSGLRIPYKDNNITVGFSIDGAFAGNLSAECLLEGVDTAWTSTGRSNRVTYNRLPPRKYLLRLRSTDGLGHYSPDTVLAFTIRLPWWRTAWAWLGAVLLLGGVFWLAHRMMRRRLRLRHLRLLRVEEAARLRRQNEQLQNELEQKNAELFTQASFIIRKNELILRLKELVDELVGKNTQKGLIPLFRRINTLLSDNLDAEADWQTFLIQFEQTHRNFFKRLKEAYPQLTTGDLRLCACLKLNMDTKDIASLMNLSVRAVENNRYRLRKKLSLQPAQNLNEFFLNID